MTTLYLDCFSGIAGDMLLGALLDLAECSGASDRVNPRLLEVALESLNLPEWSLSTRVATKRGIKGVQVSVHSPWGEERVIDALPAHAHHHPDHNQYYHHDHDHDHVQSLSLPEILALIENSSLSQRTKERSKSVFTLLGEAEATSHGVPLEDVHFHEVGMVDSIVDIVGVAWCLDELEISEVISSPPPINRGWVKCAHGLMPLPAPATAHLFKGLPTSSCEERVELVTPTGAAMIKAWAHEVTESLPDQVISAIGIGAGKRDLTSRPNLIRVFLYQRISERPTRLADTPPDMCWCVETNLDDMSPEHLAFASKKLFDAGALDVWTSPIVMKKGRSAVTLSALCHLEGRAELESAIFNHSSAIGVRFSKVRRAVLPRRLMKVMTQWGEVTVKVSLLEMSHGDRTWKIKPEFDHLKKLCESNSIPISRVHQEVISLSEAALQEASGVLWDRLESE